MDTRIPDKTPDIREVRSTPRVTPGPAQTHFKEVLASTAVQGAEQAMTMLPGGPVMALALRGAPPLPMQMNTMSGGSLTSSLGIGGASGASGMRTPQISTAEGPSAGTSSGGTVDPTTGLPTSDQAGIQGSLQQSQEMNLYYLQIQEAVNAQNRSFTALSNVIKAEHDTVKTAIGNIH